MVIVFSVVSTLIWAAPDDSDCVADFGACLRVSALDWNPSSCGNGLNLTVSGTETGHKYDMFYTDSLASLITWKVAEKGIVAAGASFTWIDCGGPDRLPPSEVSSRFYVAGIGDDPDGDGLGSAYEVLILHTNPDSSHTDNGGLSDGDADFDQDGYTNLQEYNLGTDPLDPSSYPTAVPPNLAGWWKLDEGFGTNTADSSGNALDGLLIQDINGTTPTWTTNGVLAKALSFNANGTGYVLISNSNSFGSVTSGLTVSAWILPTNNAPNGTIISKWLPDGSDGSFQLTAGRTGAVFEVFVTAISCEAGPDGALVCSTNRQDVAVTGALPNDGFWHLVTGALSGLTITSTADLYIDGVHQSGQKIGYAEQATVDQVLAPAMIGRGAGANPLPFYGVIDDVRIYNRALGTNEIAALYNAVVPPSVRTYAEFNVWSHNNNFLFFRAPEVYNGHVHADDELYFNAASGGPVFHGPVTSGTNTYAVMGGTINDIEFDQGLKLNSYQGSMADVDFDSAASTSLKNIATNRALGLMLEGSTTITFYGGTLSISNTRTDWTAHVFVPPANGIIYVANATTGTGSSRPGIVFFNGGYVSHRLLIVSESDMTIGGNITYTTDPRTNSASTDALALITKAGVWVGTGAPNNLEIDAAIMATGQSDSSGDTGTFGVINYNTGSPRGTLTVLGGIVQQVRGAVGTYNLSTGQTVTGFSKNYVYDSRFTTNPPPYFPVIINRATSSQMQRSSSGPTAEAVTAVQPERNPPPQSPSGDPVRAMVHRQAEILRALVRQHKLPRAFGHPTQKQIDEMEKNGILIE